MTISRKSPPIATALLEYIICTVPNNNNIGYYREMENIIRDEIELFFILGWYHPCCHVFEVYPYAVPSKLDLLQGLLNH